MKKLIVVESPTKARTIGRFLKKGYKILATMGHIRDLPEKRFGVKIEEEGKIKITPQYRLIPRQRKTVAQLQEEMKKAEKVILATDPDREGEAIAYHVTKIRSKARGGKQDLEKFSRIVFHEITAAAVKEALAHPRTIDMNLVNAQQARRVLDRIVGYKLSPLLWRKVRRGLSAGRVQSVAVRLIVERERERKRFKKDDYFRLWGVFKAKKGKEFSAELIKIKEKPVEKRERHQLFAGRHQTVKTIFSTLASAKKTILTFPSTFLVKEREEKILLRQPLPPFTTSKLQQEAARRFGWSAKLTMRVAQSLYEKGLITYHRTDSFNLSRRFISRARKWIKDRWGEKYLPPEAKVYKTRAKLAQEAHEAIRPTKIEREKLSRGDSRQQRLYRLIWSRALACQMTPAKLAVGRLEIKGGDFLFLLKGKRVIFPGFSQVYPVVFTEVDLPSLKKGSRVDLTGMGITSHQTQPPPRYSEASLIAALEKEGIGRPSTYAPIIFLIQRRNYVEKEGGRFLPTSLGEAVVDFLVKYFPDILSLPFTAKMEEELDEIAAGQEEWSAVVAGFWRPFIKKLEVVKANSAKVEIAVEKIGEKCPQCGQGELVVRVGRFGKFIACSRFPECKYTRPLIKEAGFNCPECGAPAVIRQTKKGKKFYGCSRWPSCKWASWKKPKT